VTDSAELLTLRLALIGVLLLFVLIVALTMRGGLRPVVSAPRTAARSRGPRLVLLVPAGTGYQPGTEFSVAGVMVLGRDGESGIVLGDASVSGAHAQLERLANGWRIVDLDSTNGTLVNGREVGSRGATLKGGERIAIGSVVLRFQV
jgi:pSer/pThr/pTyr-binding forkhead associated (FHA) protein